MITDPDLQVIDNIQKATANEFARPQAAQFKIVNKARTLSDYLKAVGVKLKENPKVNDKNFYVKSIENKIAEQAPPLEKKLIGKKENPNSNYWFISGGMRWENFGECSRNGRYYDYNWNGIYYDLRFGRKFFRFLSLFVELTRSEFGKQYGIGIKLHLPKGLYLFHNQLQGMDNVDMINHEWVSYPYGPELVVQHSSRGLGIGWQHFFKEFKDLGFYIEYSQNSVGNGDNLGKEWKLKADKISIGLEFKWKYK